MTLDDLARSLAGGLWKKLSSASTDARLDRWAYDRGEHVLPVMLHGIVAAYRVIVQDPARYSIRWTTAPVAYDVSGTVDLEEAQDWDRRTYRKVAISVERAETEQIPRYRSGLHATFTDAELAALMGATPPPGRGELIPKEEVREGDRVVLASGEHGVVTDVGKTTWRAAYPGTVGKQEVTYYSKVRLDSGRTEHPGILYREVGPPPVAIPDILFDRHYHAPGSFFHGMRNECSAIQNARAKADAARKPERIRSWREFAERSRESLAQMWQTFVAWRRKYPDALVKDYDPLLARKMQLEASSPELSDLERNELAYINITPSDWRTRYKTDDTVTAFGLPGIWQVGDVVGDNAVLIQDNDRRTVPLWLLRISIGARAPVSAMPARTFDAPKYLVDIGVELSAAGKDYFASRAVIARSLKEYLSGHGLDVHTRVMGSMVGSITLTTARGGEWSTLAKEKLSQLLPGVVVHRELARIEPYHRAGILGDPMSDYAGSDPGILFPPEEIPRFARILARYMKADGVALSRWGEELLASATAPVSVAAPVSATVPTDAAAPAGTVVLSHTPEEGTTARGDTWRVKDVLKNLGWRWWQQGQLWYVPHSRGRTSPAADLDHLAAELRHASATVEVK